MKIGTKSVLFGAHQFAASALRRGGMVEALRIPWDPRLWVAFFVHDLGYWGVPNMDGPEGEEHPTFGARIMGWLFDRVQGDLTSYAAECLMDEADCLADSHTLDGEWTLEDEPDRIAYARHADYYITAAELLDSPTGTTSRCSTRDSKPRPSVAHSRGCAWRTSWPALSSRIGCISPA